MFGGGTGLGDCVWRFVKHPPKGTGIWTSGEVVQASSRDYGIEYRWCLRS